MGEVIQLKARQRPGKTQVERPGTEARRMMTIADEIDGIVLKHLESGDIDPHDIAGLLAHRLGTLLRHIDEKSKLWDVCEKVLKKQAAID